jgi:hypothetical protein
MCVGVVCARQSAGMRDDLVVFIGKTMDHAPAPPLRPLITVSQGGWPVGQVGHLVSQRLSEAS